MISFEHDHFWQDHFSLLGKCKEKQDSFYCNNKHDSQVKGKNYLPSADPPDKCKSREKLRDQKWTTSKRYSIWPGFLYCQIFHFATYSTGIGRVLSLIFYCPHQPCVPIISHRRSVESVSELGENLLVVWKPDSSMIAVATAAGHVIFYNIVVYTEVRLVLVFLFNEYFKFFVFYERGEGR